MYIKVQAADSKRGWINVAEAQRWIKRDKTVNGWLTVSSWDETVANPIGNRLE